MKLKREGETHYRNNCWTVGSEICVVLFLGQWDSSIPRRIRCELKLVLKVRQCQTDAKMSLSRRSSTSVLVSFGCCLLLLTQAIVTVKGHALPEPSEQNLQTDSSALNLVEAPVLDQQQPSDSESSAVQPQPSARSQNAQTRQLDLDRMDSLSQSSASEIIRSKRWKLQKITPPGRSRINNRSMTAFNEMDSSEYNEDQPLNEPSHRYFHHQPVARHWNTAMQVHRRSDTVDNDFSDESRTLDEARFKKHKKKKHDEDILEQLLQDGKFDWILEN